MTFALILLGVTSLFELCLWLRPIWKYRKVFAGFLIVVSSVALGMLIGFHPSLWVGVVLVLGVYRVINLLRLVEGRTKADYLFVVARRCSFLLILTQVIVYWFSLLAKSLSLGANGWLVILSLISASFVAVLIASTLRHVKTTRPAKLAKNYATRDLPALSVLIPARNETEDLERCLESLVASTYPKLEIIVLDDCSQNKHTPEIIKSFAQAGVRFIAGELPPDSWLAKNYAYEQLLNQSSGDFLLFCGVDTRFEPDTLNKLVERLLDKNKSMASVMPVNRRLSGYVRQLLQPNRYGWELSLPRRMLNRPPVLSTCWIIKRQSLKDVGGFKAATRSPIPESYFARQIALKNDGYSFIRSGSVLGLKSEKPFDSQLGTAIRTRYPQLHRRIELVAVLSLLEFASFLLPIGSLVYALVGSKILLLVLAVLNIAMLAYLYSVIARLTYQRFMLKSFIAWPLAAALDIGLLNYSMWRYEFREVIWKGRNVCLPVMRMIDPS